MLRILAGFACFKCNSLGSRIPPYDWTTVPEGEFDEYQRFFHLNVRRTFFMPKEIIGFLCKFCSISTEDGGWKTLNRR